MTEKMGSEIVNGQSARSMKKRRKIYENIEFWWIFRGFFDKLNLARRSGRSLNGLFLRRL